MGRIVKQPDVRRQELLKIGVDLYFKAGEKGVSIQQVVKQANVATGLFYYYFKTKDEFLDEALNSYIDKEMHAFEVILKNDTLASEKLNTVLDAYFEYAEKMAPFRSCNAFHTEKHFALTKILTERLKKEVCEVLRQGLAEKTFEISNIDLTAGFIVSGLSSILDSNADINIQSLAELKRFVNMILKG